MNEVEFPAPPNPVYPGGCTLEPAPFALDFLVNWRADVGVAGVTHRNVVVLSLLRDVVREPERFGVSGAAALAARARFLEWAGQVLERDGGDVRWLEREFQR